MAITLSAAAAERAASFLAKHPGAAGIPGDGEAAVEHGVGDLARLVDRLAGLSVGRAEGETVEAQLGEGRREAVGDEFELGHAAPLGHLQELHAIADRADRAYQIMTEPGGDQRAEIG